MDRTDWNVGDAACPNRTQLAQFAVGNLPVESVELLAAHLVGCADCQVVLASLQDHPDDLVARLRTSTPPVGFEHEPECAAAVEEAVRVASGHHSACLNERCPLASEFSADVNDPPLPPRLGNYQVLDRVGIGGMGTVYRAIDLRLGRTVALKVIRSGSNTSRSSVVRFQHEAKTVAQLDHPQIVPIYEVGEHDGLHWLSMKWIAGRSLAEMCSAAPLDAHAAAHIVTAIARAMQYAHERGVLHRDLKPANILLDQDGHPHVADFGLAKRLDCPADLTQVGTVVGTPSYMAPEQALGQLDQITIATDVYGLGAVLYTALTGRPPFQAATSAETCRQVHQQSVVAPSRLRPDVNRDLETVCLKCLEKEPSRRYASAGTLADDLQRWLQGQPIAARRASPSERLRGWCRRRPGLAALTATVLLLSTVLLAGAPVTAIWMHRERNRAVQNEQRALSNERRASQNLFEALAAQAESSRGARHLSQRTLGLDAVARAAKLLPHRRSQSTDMLRLRNAAIASLALSDLRPKRRFLLEVGYYDFLDPRFGRLVQADAQGVIHVLRAEDGAELVRCDAFAGDLSQAVFSPSGHTLAAYQASRSGDAALTVIDVPRDATLWQIRKRVWSIAFSSDDRQLAVGDEAGMLHVFETATGNELRRFSLAEGPVLAAFRPGDEHLAVVDKTTCVKIIHALTGESVMKLDHPPMPTNVAWHPGGRLLATTCDDEQVRVWDVDTGSLISALQGQHGRILYIYFAPQGDLLASGSWDGTTWFWDPLSGQPLLQTNQRFLGFARDGTELALAETTSHGCEVVVSEFIRSRELRQLNPRGMWMDGRGAVDFSSDARLLVSADGTYLRLWDVASGRQLQQVALAEGYSTQFDPAGCSVWAGGQDGVFRWSVSLEGRSSGEVRATLTQPPQRFSEHGSRPPNSTCALSADGRWLASWADGSTVLLQSLTEEPIVHRLEGHLSAGDVVFSPDGRWIATYSGPGVKVWETATGQLVTTLDDVDGRAELCFSPDGRWLGCGLAAEYRQFDTRQWSLHRKIARHGVNLHGPIAFSPDGRAMAIAPNQFSVVLLDAATGLPLADLTVEDSSIVHRLTFTRDGTRLAVATQRRGIFLWDVGRIRRHLAGMGLDW